MFTNIGGKIKILAKTLCAIGIIFSVFFAAFLGFSARAFLSSLPGAQPQTTALFGIVVAIATVLFGGLFSWISSFVLFGYGELIDEVTRIERNTKS